MIVNPLLFMPSPRDIPDVIKWWDKIPYDKIIEKYRMPLDAYTRAKNFFLENKQYTHFVICPDDLEVTPDAIEQLIDDVEFYNYDVIAGMCNIDEEQPDTYAIQPIHSQDFTQDHPNVTFGSWYMKDKKPILPDKDIIEVGFAGFPCEMISRRIMNQVTMEGAANDKESNFDWQFTRECYKLKIPIMVDTRVNLYHRRKEQYLEAKAFKNRAIHIDEGRSILLKAGEQYK